MALKAGDYSLALDTHDPNADVNFVSHAHSDHTSGLRKGKRVLSSDATRELIEIRKKTTLLPLEAPSCVKLLNSGHMLGSKQLHIKYEEQGCSVLYSGDYQMQESPAAESIETTEADILILDSTYPYPNIEFEDRNETITTIQKYTLAKIDSGVTIFGAYTMGKAQELIKILNEAGMAPFVSSKIAAFSEVYKKHNISLDYLTYNDDSEMTELARKVSVGVVDINKLDEIKGTISNGANRRVFTAVATGFAKMFKFNTDVQFTLSDHADFKQATEYIDLCNPKIIYTCGSSAPAFAKNLSAEGYPAHALRHISEAGSVAKMLDVSVMSHTDQVQ